MSVVRIKETEGKPQSGGGMDRVVERRGLSRQVQIGLAAAAVLLLGLLFYLFAPGANSQTVEASRLTISTVERGRFDDFLPLRARVEPLVTVSSTRSRAAGSSSGSSRTAPWSRPARCSRSCPIRTCS